MSFKKKILFILLISLFTIFLYFNVSNAATVLSKDSNSYNIPDIPEEVLNDSYYVIGKNKTSDEIRLYYITKNDGFIDGTPISYFRQENGNKILMASIDYKDYSGSIYRGLIVTNEDTGLDEWSFSKVDMYGCPMHLDKYDYLYSTLPIKAGFFPNSAVLFNPDTDNFVIRGTSTSGPGEGSGESGNDGSTSGSNTTTTIDYSSTGVFSWIAQGFNNIGNFFTSLIDGINSLGESIGNWFSSLGSNLQNWFSDLGLGIQNFFAGIPEFFANFWQNCGDFFKGLFVPSEERLNALTSAATDKFTFIESIKISINSLKDIINNTGNAPSLSVIIKPTKYTDEATVKILDFSWYKQFKPYGDLIITGFVYLVYIWRIFVNLPNIISGVGGSFNDVSAQLGDIEAYNRFGFGRSSNTLRRQDSKNGGVYRK